MIFEYWERSGDHIHPDDKIVLSNTDHELQLNCLAGPYRGPLRTATVVLLFLSPGFEKDDLELASTNEGKEYFRRIRQGNCALPSEDEHQAAYIWSKKILDQFDLDYDAVREKVAFLNICGYRSKKFHDYHLLSALPSSRATLNWAQNQLFPSARKGRRIVVCLRSHKYWGLKPGTFDGALFSPKCVRSGRMIDSEIRERAKAAVQNALE